MRKYFLYVLILEVFYFQGCSFFNRKNIREMSDFERITFERTNDPGMEEFIDSLIIRMSLKAKIGQLTLLNEVFYIPEVSNAAGTEGYSSIMDTAKVAAVINEFQIGSFLAGGKRSALQWFEIDWALQEINLKYSENHIPVIIGIDHKNGTNNITEGTIFPHEINIAATFNPEFAFQMGACTAREAAALGHNWNFAPDLDIIRNKSWAGLCETFGEDTYLASVMGSSCIHGLQETRVEPYSMASCAIHFPGNLFTQEGPDSSLAEISPQGLQEFHVPVFKAAIDSGVLSVMINSGEINGIPVYASHYYLTDVLRGQLGFQGVAIMDYMDIKHLNTGHIVTDNEKESVFKSIIAGIDVTMTTTTGFCSYLQELVEEGKIPEERIDLSVRRILRLKYKIGLFKNPCPSKEYMNNIGSLKAKNSSGKAASESVVLMKNDNKILPLYKPLKLVIAGMNANLRMSLCGGWSNSWQEDEEKLHMDSIKTLFQAIKEEFEYTNVVWSDINSLKNQASDATAVLIVTGENPNAEGWGKIDNLELPDSESELIKTAISSGRPVVLILLEGRPRIIGELFDHVQAALFAGLPGMFGGESIAGILSGRFNPSGKMAITYPYQSEHIIPYNYKPVEFSYLSVNNKDIQRYTIADFGSGLSYTTYTYSNLVLSDTLIYSGQRIKASVQVTNTGQREGYEAVLWYISDEVGTYTRPVKQLKYFEKKFILPGEVKGYDFLIEPVKDLAYPDEYGELLLNQGYYLLKVGSLSARFRFAAKKT